MARAHYGHNIHEYQDRPCIIIIDNNGPVSVTNDIENVVEEIAKRHGLNPVEHTIVYRSSDGIWDGYVFSTKQFKVFNEATWRSAVMRFIDEE